ncbi:hypothetical protein [Xenorhabdus sp. Sc-CR9]|uniref:hypothetical protein n=1 Tax=Xenorhabdus sp. Sc-CR9 TaxID=2584468 RepID=UPI001F2EA441|nr:hypothetical protein [Xenorhabdus sp. Sc-CR9]
MVKNIYPCKCCSQILRSLENLYNHYNRVHSGNAQAQAHAQEIGPQIQQQRRLLAEQQLLADQQQQQRRLVEQRVQQIIADQQQLLLAEQLLAEQQRQQQLLADQQQRQQQLLPVKCDYCDFVAKNQRGLKAHIRTMHSDQIQQQAQREAGRQSHAGIPSQFSPPNLPPPQPDPSGISQAPGGGPMRSRPQQYSQQNRFNPIAQTLNAVQLPQPSQSSGTMGHLAQSLQYEQDMQEAIQQSRITAYLQGDMPGPSHLFPTDQSGGAIRRQPVSTSQRSAPHQQPQRSPSPYYSPVPLNIQPPGAPRPPSPPRTPMPPVRATSPVRPIYDNPTDEDFDDMLAILRSHARSPSPRR